jgi:UDP-3-O-[3-hydroxymyristoyl] glucosamine N-acyltransferase
LLHQLNIRIGFIKDTTPPVIDPSASVSPLSFIGTGVKIGARSIISPFVYIGDGAHIGSDCLIKSGAIIGQDGFGFERDENEIPLRLTHLGNVVICNNVEIGSLTTICRGTLDNTIINEHAKIDDHVHIAHNVVVGKGAMVVACAEISGGVSLGDFSWIGPNSSIIQKKNIGVRSFIGIGSNVLKNVPDGAVFAGNPAREILKK